MEGSTFGGLVEAKEGCEVKVGNTIYSGGKPVNGRMGGSNFNSHFMVDKDTKVSQGNNYYGHAPPRGSSERN